MGTERGGFRMDVISLLVGIILGIIGLLLGF